MAGKKKTPLVGAPVFILFQKLFLFQRKKTKI